MLNQGMWRHIHLRWFSLLVTLARLGRNDTLCAASISHSEAADEGGMVGPQHLENLIAKLSTSICCLGGPALTATFRQRDLSLDCGRTASTGALARRFVNILLCAALEEVIECIAMAQKYKQGP